MSKLERLLFLQGNRCFFCEQPIPPGEATVEHLLPRSKGGAQDDDNCVACCRTINSLLGNLSVKDKLRALLSQRGQIVCPAHRVRSTAEGDLPEVSEASAPVRPDLVEAVRHELVVRCKSRPKKMAALRNLVRTIIGRSETEEALEGVIQELEDEQYLRIDGEKVRYCNESDFEPFSPPNKPIMLPAPVDEDIPF